MKANTLTQNVETYYAKFGIDVKTIEVISNQDENNPDKAVAMKLELSYVHKDTVMDAKLWPKEVRVNEWYLKSVEIGKSLINMSFQNYQKLRIATF